jgi:methyl-accepting chemotaxis protein
MKWFLNLKISQKLVSAFLTISLLIGVVGYIGISNMNIINSNAKTMYEYNLQSIKSLTSIKQNIADIRADLLKMVYQQNKNQQNVDLGKEIIGLYDDNTKLVDDYEKALLSKEEEETFTRLKSDLAAYKAASDRIIILANGKNFDEADNQFNKVTEIRKQIYADLDKELEINNNQATNKYGQNNSTYNSSLYSTIIIILAGILIAIILGLLISGIISRN